MLHDGVIVKNAEMKVILTFKTIYFKISASLGGKRPLSFINPDSNLSKRIMLGNLSSGYTCCTAGAYGIQLVHISIGSLMKANGRILGVII